MELRQMLFALSKAAGPTGREEPALAVAQSLLEPLVERVWREPTGSLVGFLPGKQGKRKLLLDAHLDEVSLVVIGHERGFLKLGSVFHGIDVRLLPASRMMVCGSQPIYGVVTCLPPHILSAEDREKPFPLEKLRLDCGLQDEEAKRLAPVGTPVIFAAEPVVLAGQRVAGKALDNRAGFAVLLRMLQLLDRDKLEDDLYILGSVQEESTLLGASAAAGRLLPDAAVVVDATFGMTPDCPEDESFQLGGGPAIGIGPVLTSSISNKLRELADKLQIPVQLEVMAGSTGTNAMCIQIAGEGIPCGMLSYPLRYMHSPREVVDLRDLEAAASLLAAYVTEGGRSRHG